MPARLLTMDEAARELAVSRRALQDLVKRHPHYVANGRRKLFTAGDIDALIAAMRHEAAIQRAEEEARRQRRAKKQCRTGSSRPGRGAPPIGMSAAPIAGHTWSDLQARLAARRRSAGSASGPRRPTVVAEEPAGAVASRPPRRAMLAFGRAQVPVATDSWLRALRGQHPRQRPAPAGRWPARGRDPAPPDSALGARHGVRL